MMTGTWPIGGGPLRLGIVMLNNISGMTIAGQMESLGPGSVTQTNSPP